MNPRSLVFPFLFVLVLQPWAGAQELGEVAFRQAQREMGHDLRLLCVAAHPDDEDGASLALHRYRYGVKTYALIATRGEGGQNEIGPELYADLGVIRTKEMQAAAEVTGAELLFLDMPEFGYSKTAEETLANWGHEETLRRMVRVLREVQPHVIITHHGRDNDHGHHQAIGAVLQEAFDQAGDPAVFPDQIQAGLAPWQPWRLYIRAWDRGAASVELDISALDEWRGQTYAEIAAHALELHASQGMTQFIERYLTGRPKAYYDLVKEAPIPDVWSGSRMDASAGPLFDGVPAAIQAERAALSQSPAPRLELKPLILEALRVASQQRANLEADRLWTTVNRAAAAAAMIELEARADDTLVTPGQTVKIAVRLSDLGELDGQSATLRVEMRPGFRARAPEPVQRQLSPAGDAEAVFEVAVPESQAPTLPRAAHLFEPGFLTPQMTVVASVLCGQTLVEVREPVHVDIAPAVGIEFLRAPYLVRSGQSSIEVPLLVTNHQPQAQDITLLFTAPQGWILEESQQVIRFAAEDEQAIVPLRLPVPEGVVAGTYPLQIGVAAQQLPVHAEIHVVDLAVPEGARVGVIDSFDTTYTDALAKLGIDHETLDLEDFRADRLDQFTAIIVGMRAYQYRPDLVANNQTLLDYVKRGGTVLVNYQKTFDWKPEYAPYPIQLSRNRVTLEDVPVTALQPDHPLLTTPNLLGPETWENWVQERGLYFAETWAPEYTPLLAMNDPGEDIPPGSLLVAKHGEGTYIFTALVWYRQLRELHPGALKFLANVMKSEF